MFGYNSKKEELLGLHQKIGRFLNDAQYTRIEEERQRTESRTRVGLPCLLFLFEEADAPSSYVVGVTTDLSLHGMAMIVHEKLELKDYILIFGAADQRLFVKATCRRAIRSHFGTFAHAFEFVKMLRSKEYPIVAQAVNMLDQAETGAAEPVVLAPTVPRSGLFSSMWQSLAAR